MRMSFALFVFELIILLAIVPRAKCSQVIHDGFWPVKFLLLLVIYVVSFFIPHGFFLAWAWICRAGSFLFLVIQAYFLLNLAYT